MRLRHRWYAFTLVAAGAMLCAGCGPGVPMAHVKGTVTLDRKPLAKGTIRFESAGHRPATGKIVNGEIVELTTFTNGDGVPVGAQKIAIWAAEEADSAVVPNPGESKVGPNYMSGRSLIHEIYNNPDTSGLTADIKSGGNVVAFELFSTPSKDGK